MGDSNRVSETVPRRRGPRRGTILFALVVGLCVSASVAQAVSHVESGTPSDIGIPVAQADGSDSVDASSLTAIAPVPAQIDPVPVVETTAGTLPSETVISETPDQKVAEVSLDSANDIPQAALVAYKRAALAIAQSISFEPSRCAEGAADRHKRFYLTTPDGSSEVLVDAPVYWFNDMDWHSVRADPFFRYSVRVDGVFEPDFLEQIRRQTARRARGPR